MSKGGHPDQLFPDTGAIAGGLGEDGAARVDGQRPGVEFGGWLLLPREHGAWALLLQPFLCAALLGRRWDWLYVPALMLVLTVFVMREPLVVLARQRWRWRETRTASGAAQHCLLWQIPLSAILFLVCLRFLPVVPLLVLAAGAAVLTIVALWMTLHNLQRSIALQLVSSFGLATTGLLAALVAVRHLPAWSWLLCGLLVSHSLASILIVRTRLELRARSRLRASGSVPSWAWVFQIVLAGVAIGLVTWSEPGLGVVVGFSVVVNTLELLRVRSREKLVEPLRRVGLRAVGVSLAHSAFAVAVLWS